MYINIYDLGSKTCTLINENGSFGKKSTTKAATTTTKAKKIPNKQKKSKENPHLILHTFYNIVSDNISCRQMKNPFKVKNLLITLSILPRFEKGSVCVAQKTKVATWAYNKILLLYLIKLSGLQ